MRELQVIGFHWLMSSADFLVRKFVDGMPSTFEFLEGCDGVEGPDLGVSEAVVHGGAEGGVPYYAVLRGFDFAELVDEAAKVSDDFRSLVRLHVRPDCVERLAAWGCFEFDELAFGTVVDVQDFVGGDRGVAVYQFESLILCVHAGCFDYSVGTDTQDFTACVWIILFFGKLHAPGEARGDGVIFVLRFFHIGATAPRHF